MNTDFLFGVSFSALFFILYAVYINLSSYERRAFKIGWLLGLSIGVIIGAFVAAKLSLSF